MKHSILFIVCLLCCLSSYSQQYRLAYGDNSLPELYDKVDIFVQQQKGNGYTTLSSGKYKLSTNEGEYRNGTLTIDRNELQQNKGFVNFTLTIQGQTIPLQLQLPVLKSIRFNLYTDSIKPILNYYVNVEGEFSSGRILPLDSNSITIQVNHGSMIGMEWVLPAEHNFESVTFTAIAKNAPKLAIVRTVYLKKYSDPRDKAGYEDAGREEIIKGNKKRR